MAGTGVAAMAGGVLVPGGRERQADRQTEQEADAQMQRASQQRGQRAGRTPLPEPCTARPPEPVASEQRPGPLPAHPGVAPLPRPFPPAQPYLRRG